MHAGITRERRMRQPERRRKNPKRLCVGLPPAGTDLIAVAARVSYKGSVYHKDVPSFAGRVPRPVPARSVCPRELAGRLDDVQQWLREAIRRGHVSEFWIGGFPKYVWRREGETVFEGELMDPAAGTYKGYPLESHQRVRGLA